MNRFLDFFAQIPSSKSAERILLGLIILLCAIGNLPWHLDNYDQAKQACVAYEIAHGGNAWYQHTPKGDTATKPPLAGWVSLPIYWASGSWDIAWRLPGFACTLFLLWLLMKEGRRSLPIGGALLAACAFGLNLMTPRLATLVRTDMMLTLWITLCGWMIYRKVESAMPWTTRERWLFFAFMLAAFFTKGPILYAFILPGMVAFWFLAPRDRRGLVWCGWWPWVVPLALFLLWLGIGIKSYPDFYNDIVVKEFFSRFDQSLKDHERKQPIWFYFPHLLHKFLPWSVLALALPVFSQNVRRVFKSRPEILWLACWALGGVLCMTLVPSKRVDRIFPVVPPLCLLVVAMVAACQCGARIRTWCGVALVLSACISGGYFLTIVPVGYFEKSDALVRFGQDVREQATAAGVKEIGVARGRDEGMFMYCASPEFLSSEKALRLWKEGKLDALVIPQRLVANDPSFPVPALSSGFNFKNEKEPYLFFLRSP